MANIFLIDLEAVESRYTGQWKVHVPDLLKNAGHNVKIIEGPADIPTAATPGAFLNFGGTNIYKANQIEQIGKLFCIGSVKEGDHFLFTDAWHPGIINLKYMSELLGIPVKIHALWHAGSYDPHDFLGRLIGDAPWVRHAEQSFFHAVDYNYFATDFHIEMFIKNLFDMKKPAFVKAEKTMYMDSGKIIRTGWPMEYMENTLELYKGMAKRNLIVFPHRVAPEKQVEIFRDLKEQLPQYEFVVCQDQQLTKNEYHNLLGESKLVFSASLQETLGISSCSEGPLLDVIPLVPDRLSYSEIFRNHRDFLYPSEWTENWNSYIDNRTNIKNRIINIMENYKSFLPSLRNYNNTIYKEFFHSNNLLNNIK